MNKYYSVSIMAGHNKDFSTIEYLTFYFKAPDAIAAADRARGMPGVKHNRINAVRDVREITYSEYNNGRRVSAYARRTI